MLVKIKNPHCDVKRILIGVGPDSNRDAPVPALAFV